MGPPAIHAMRLADFGDVFMPSEATEPILARPVRDGLTDWLTEIWAADELIEVGLKPRYRALFSGPPGTGKTTLAHHLAARIGLPMLAVRPDRIMTTYVGESARALGKLFDSVKVDVEAGNSPMVLFFDEFESLAQKRMHEGRNQVAEADHNSMVNVLLQRLDAHSGFVIAATNRGDAVDPAVWRRFEIHIQIDPPGHQERVRIIERYLAPFQLTPQSLKNFADAFDTATPALIRQFFEAVKRYIVVGPKAGWNMQREAVVDKIIATVQPHPDLGKPRLWSHGPKDHAVRWLEWPLPRADAPKTEAA